MDLNLHVFLHTESSHTEKIVDKILGLATTLDQKVSTIMSQADDLKAALATEDEEIKQLLAYAASAVAAVTDLQNQLAAAIANQAPDLSPLIAEVQAQTATIAAALPAPAPVPPADAPADTTT